MNGLVKELRILRAYIRVWYYTLWMATYIGLPAALEKRREVRKRIRRQLAWEEKTDE